MISFTNVGILKHGALLGGLPVEGCIVEKDNMNFYATLLIE